MNHKRYVVLLLFVSSIMKPFSFFSDDIAVDLGTSNTVIFINGSLVDSIPSVVAVDRRTGKVLCVGEEAKNMLGKTPAHIAAIRPMQDGVIRDYDVTLAMLHYIFQKAIDCRIGIFRGPRMVVGVPCSVTQPERRAIEDAAKEVGARNVFTIMEPMAAAIGVGLPVEEPRGTMVVDIGGGTTDIVVISLKAPVVSHAVRVAGDAMDASIVKYLKSKYNLIIGDQTAENIKKEIGVAYIKKGLHEKKMTVGGADVMTGVPREIVLTSSDVADAVHECIQKIMSAIRDVLNKTPAELTSDIAKNGILLVGGGSLLRGFGPYIEQELGLKVQVPKNPIYAVAQGIGKVVENFSYYKESLVSKA